MLDLLLAAGDSEAVLRKSGHVLLIVALLSASGTHWLVLQSVAWTTMLASNLRTSSLGEALERTFDGRHPCRLCRQIARDRQDEKKTEFRSETRQLEFIYTTPAFIFETPPPPGDFCAVPDLVDCLPHAPPVPPPRSLPG